MTRHSNLVLSAPGPLSVTMTSFPVELDSGCRNICFGVDCYDLCLPPDKKLIIQSNGRMIEIRWEAKDE